MKTKKKILIIIPAVILVLLLSAAVWFFEFSEGGYMMTVPYRHSYTRIADNVYVNSGNAMGSEYILGLIDEARERDRAFFRELVFDSETVFIIFDDEKLTKKLGIGKSTYTVDFPEKRHYICISEEYFILDILAHEITHAELHTRLSSDARSKLPSWFDEGLATQNDYREQYSYETWKEQTDNGRTALRPEDMDEPKKFYAGEAEDRRFRYMNAKHIMAEWIEIHGREGLLELFDRLNSGEDFDSAYGM